MYMNGRMMVIIGILMVVFAPILLWWAVVLGIVGVVVVAVFMREEEDKFVKQMRKVRKVADDKIYSISAPKDDLLRQEVDRAYKESESRLKSGADGK